MTLDAEGRVKQTRVVHVQDGEDQTWGGWHSGNLISFVEQQAGLADAEAPTPQKLPADAEPPGPTSLPSAWLAGLAPGDDVSAIAEPPPTAAPLEWPELSAGLELAITRVTASLLPAEHGEPPLSGPRLRGEVTFRLSGVLSDLLACRHTPYLLQLTANDLSTSATTTLGETQQLIEPLDEPAPDPQRPHTFTILCASSLDFDPPEQPGSYQLHGTVTLPTRNTSDAMAGRIFRIASNQSEQL